MDRREREDESELSAWPVLWLSCLLRHLSNSSGPALLCQQKEQLLDVYPSQPSTKRGKLFGQITNPPPLSRVASSFALSLPVDVTQSGGSSRDEFLISFTLLLPDAKSHRKRAAHFIFTLCISNGSGGGSGSSRCAIGVHSSRNSLVCCLRVLWWPGGRTGCMSIELISRSIPHTYTQSVCIAIRAPLLETSILYPFNFVLSTI